MQRRADLKVRYDWFYRVGSILFFVAFIRGCGVMKSQQNITQKIDAVDMMIEAIKQDVSQCAFVEYKQDGVFAASFELRQLAEGDLGRALDTLRQARTVCENITESHGMKTHMAKAA